jgi:hypothetical protein
LMQGAGGKALLLLTAGNVATARVTFTAPIGSVKGMDGTSAVVSGNSFDAGDFQAWQVKAYDVVIRTEAAR